MSDPVSHEHPLLLASASPRRRRLLTWLEIPFEVGVADIVEDLTSPLTSLPPILARTIAADKARAAMAASDGTATILACDTIVVLERRIMGKPADLAGAFEMLRALSGRTHTVITGVALQLPEWDDPRTFAVTTPVTMRELSEADMQAWADQGELLGCAGAYNIEHHLASVAIDECYQNVAGLPLCHIRQQLARHGFASASPVAACDTARCVTCELGPRLVAPHPGVRP